MQTGYVCVPACVCVYARMPVCVSVRVWHVCMHVYVCVLYVHTCVQMYPCVRASYQGECGPSLKTNWEMRYCLPTAG